MVGQLCPQCLQGRHQGTEGGMGDLRGYRGMDALEQLGQGCYRKRCLWGMLWGPRSLGWFRSWAPVTGQSPWCSGATCLLHHSPNPILPSAMCQALPGGIRTC